MKEIKVDWPPKLIDTDGLVSTAIELPEPCLFTLEHIKQAFWGTFDGVGEVWFDYLGSDKECDASTEEHWQEFMGRLTKGADNG